MYKKGHNSGYALPPFDEETHREAHTVKRSARGRLCIDWNIFASAGRMVLVV